MPKYKIHRSYGYVGTDSYEVIEASSIEDAEEYAKDFAFERVEFWAEEITDDQYEEEGGY